MMDAPLPVGTCPRRREVSIHAPVMGATSARRSRCRPRSCFNSRARDGRDPRQSALASARLVSIHAPVMGATERRAVAERYARVSIHAPAWGATGSLYHKVPSNGKAHFPRSPSAVLNDSSVKEQYKKTIRFTKTNCPFREPSKDSLCAWGSRKLTKAMAAPHPAPVWLRHVQSGSSSDRQGCSSEDCLFPGRRCLPAPP